MPVRPPGIILAVADYAEDPKANLIPPVLRLGFDVRYFNKLPADGGLRDQPAGLLRQVKAALSTYDAYAALSQTDLQWAEFAERHPEYWRVISYVERLLSAYGQRR